MVGESDHRVYSAKFTVQNFAGHAAKFRQLLDEGCSEDKFTEILERNGTD